MNDSLTSAKMIDQYLRGELAPSVRAAFKQSLKHNPELRNKIIEYRNSERIIRLTARSVKNEETIKKLQENDDATWTRLIQNFTPMVEAIVEATTHQLPPSSREDIISSVWSHLAININKISPTIPLQLLVRRVAARICLAALKGKIDADTASSNPDSKIFSDITQTEDQQSYYQYTPLDSIMTKERNKIILDAIDKLDSYSRQFLEMQFFEGLPLPEIYKRMKVDGILVQRALKFIRNEVEKAENATFKNSMISSPFSREAHTQRHDPKAINDGTHIIWDYVDGTLAPEELVSFEKRMASDTSLQEEVESHQAFLCFVDEAAAKKRLQPTSLERKLLNEWKNRYLPVDQPPAKQTVWENIASTFIFNRSWTTPYIRFATIGVLCILLLSSFFYFRHHLAVNSASTTIHPVEFAFPRHRSGRVDHLGPDLKNDEVQQITNILEEHLIEALPHGAVFITSAHSSQKQRATRWQIYTSYTPLTHYGTFSLVMDLRDHQNNTYVKTWELDFENIKLLQKVMPEWAHDIAKTIKEGNPSNNDAKSDTTFQY